MALQRLKLQVHRHLGKAFHLRSRAEPRTAASSIPDPQVTALSPSAPCKGTDWKYRSKLGLLSALLDLLNATKCVSSGEAVSAASLLLGIRS